MDFRDTCWVESNLPLGNQVSRCPNTQSFSAAKSKWINATEKKKKKNLKCDADCVMEFWKLEPVYWVRWDAGNT